ncbi:Serine/threonine protein kinase [Nonomuraea pusilla]|uniref:Serine/threonine protein kinase n=2 Tax=Nonomuraea pusilla TaxID=46177 RepID=A0A1H7FMY9_9ACTN|nr:Serine/threonine protein kinase [Nonomuraea pusilla]
MCEKALFPARTFWLIAASKISMDVLVAGDPQRLGEYWLAGRLGAGGQGVVYEGYAEDGARVAIKVLHGDQAAQLAKEAAAAQRVSSFCTARVIEAHLEGPRPYLVSEYVPGPSLRSAVADGRRFHGGDLHRLATAVATALTAIHEAGVVHRDLKPDNVLLGPDGPRVIDFGIARTAEMSLTATGLVTGTPTYMAPEVFSGHRAGAPADVFAWGGIMLFAATGADPFQAESLGGVMHRVLASSPDLDVLPEPLRSLVGAALMKDPRERPSARQLLLALVSGDGRIDTRGLLARGDSAAAQMAGADDDPALGTLAEDSYELLGPAERELVPEVFLRLVAVGERDELTPRHAHLSELVEGRPPAERAAITRILEVFAYLLGRDGEEIRLAHPALPLAWPRLRRWIDADRDGLAVHGRILTAAKRWAAGGRKDGDLFQAATLEHALQWAAASRRHITLSPAERDFLESSARLTRRRARRTRLVSLSLAGLLVVALAAGGLAVRQGAIADSRAELLAARLNMSESIRLAALAGTIRRTDPRLGMLLSVAAWRLKATPQARAALNASLAQRERAMFRDPYGSDLADLSDDGRTLVSAGDGQVRLWDVRTGRRTASVPVKLDGGRLTEIALSPSGRTLVGANATHAGAWDTRTGKVVASSAYRRIAYKETGWIAAVRKNEGAEVLISSGGRVVAATPQGRTGVVSPDRTWHAVDRDEGLTVTNVKEGWSEVVGKGTYNRGEAIFSGNGRLLATLSRQDVQFWEMADFQLLTKVKVLGDGELGVTPVGAFDGSTFRYLLGDQVFSVDVGDLMAPREERDPVDAAAFSKDGRYLVVTGTEGSATVHPVAAAGATPMGKAIATIPAPDPPGAFDISGDGRLAAVAGGRVTVTDLATGKDLGSFAAGGGLLPFFSPDGTRLALKRGSSVELWDWRSGRRLWQVAARPSEVAFTPDGRRMAVVGRDLRLLDAATGGGLGGPFGDQGADAEGGMVWFTHSGRELITLDGRGRVTRWDIGSRTVVGVPAREISGGSGAYSPVEDLIVLTQERGRVLLFDPVSGGGLGRSADTGGGLDPVNGELLSVAFTPDGAEVLTVDRNATIRRFPVAAPAVVAAVCAKAGSSLTAQEWAGFVPALPYREICPSAPAATSP